MKTNNLDSFEEFVKETLSGEEAVYNPSDWNDLSQRLDVISPKPFYKSNWFIGGAAMVALGVSAVAFYPSSDQVAEQNKEIVALVEDKTTSVIPETLPVENTESVEKIGEANPKNELKENKNTSSETINKKNTAGNRVDENHQPPQDALLPETSSLDETSVKDIQEETVEQPIATYTTSGNLAGCKGIVVHFEAQEQANVKYLWSFGDGEYSNEIRPSHQFDKSGTFQVDLIVQSTIDEKVLSKSTDKHNITVYESPNLEIVSNKEVNRGLTTVNYTIVGDEVQKMFWNLGNGKTATAAEVTTTYRNRGGYKVLLEATSINGCKSVVEHNLFVEEDYNLLAPNAFTPDGDGLNDLFIPEALKSMDCNFTMVIRSRAEGIVFETTSLDRPWDGKNQKTGMDCPETNYVWVVNLINEEGEKEQYTGTILIKR